MYDCDIYLILAYQEQGNSKRQHLNLRSHQRLLDDITSF